MKIAFYTFTVLEHGGGLEKYYIETAAGLMQSVPNDLSISIVTLDEKILKHTHRLLSVYYLKKFDKQIRLREDTINIQKKLGKVRYVKCRSFRELKQELANYDIIYAKNEILDLSVLKFLRYKKLPPIIVGVHTPIHYPYAPSFHAKLHNLLYLGLPYKYLLKGVSRIHVPNSNDYELTKDRLRCKRVNKILYPFQSHKKRIRTNESTKFRIIFVGRITEQKGVDVLIDCVSRLSRESLFQYLEFKVAGTGDRALTENIKQLSLQHNNVSYLGHVENERINSLYDWADAVVIPSRYETVSYVALEAGANGKIAIASDIPGPREVIKNAKTGFLIDLDSDQFAQKIKELYEMKKRDKKNFNQIGQTAQAHIAKKFDPQSIYKQLHTMFKS